MDESNLYGGAVAGAAYGGIVVGSLGFLYQLLLAISKNHSEPLPDQRVAFQDARIIACISLVPQMVLLSLPFLYPNASVVPKILGPAAIFVAAMLVCVWSWLALKTVKAGWLHNWSSALNLLIFSAPSIPGFVVIVQFNI